MSETTYQVESKAVGAQIPWSEFLSACPPGHHARVRDLAVERRYPGSALTLPRYDIAFPELTLRCGSQRCGGERAFACDGDAPDGGTIWDANFYRYVCKNCGKSEVLFPVLTRRDLNSLHGEAIKIGQWPPFGPYTPARVITLIGPDRELYLKGRRAETQDMGIGAFAYYRRVVENQKNRLLDEIIRVAKRTKGDTGLTKQLEQAKAEGQFARAVESVKEAMPAVLRINGHNPLTLLHSALSKGLHVECDEECLTVAGNIRVILTKLAENIQHALKDEQEIKGALSSLLNKREGDGRES